MARGSGGVLSTQPSSTEGFETTYTSLPSIVLLELEEQKSGKERNIDQQVLEGNGGGGREKRQG